MSRNPHATNLRHFKPKRIEDTREATRAKFDKMCELFAGVPEVWGPGVDNPQMAEALAKLAADDD